MILENDFCETHERRDHLVIGRKGIVNYYVWLAHTVSHTEKIMDRYQLKGVTQGKNHCKSLVFHFQDIQTRRNYEALLNHVNSKGFNVR